MVQVTFFTDLLSSTYNNFSKSIMAANTWQIGDIKITAVIELEDVGGTIQSIIPEAIAKRLEEMTWLQPQFVERDGSMLASVNTFLVETEEVKILIDTGNGNSKNRPGMPEWGNLETNYLHKLGNTGALPSRVDYVINTHLHFDHVGWNTQLIYETWEPTFSNAEYIFPKKDFDYWINDPKGEMEDDLLGIKDSIMPVVEANQHKLVDADYQVTDGVKLIATPGHTPGHVSIEIESNGEKAIIAGDLFYHPCQVTELDWTTEVDNDPNQVVKSRKKVFAEVANKNTILLAAHTPTPIAGRVITEAGAYKFQPL